MHYKNGREAKNGDKVVRFIPATWDGAGQPTSFNLEVGILYDAQPGNDFCNGRLAPISGNNSMPNLKECLHLDDVLAKVGDGKLEAGSKG